jgi:hypothetical protein
VGSEVKFAAAHEKMTTRIWAGILASFIDEFRAANWTIIPPVLLRRLACGTSISGFFRHRKISNGRRITYLLRSLNRFLAVTAPLVKTAIHTVMNLSLIAFRLPL